MNTQNNRFGIEEYYSLGESRVESVKTGLESLADNKGQSIVNVTTEVTIINPCWKSDPEYELALASVKDRKLTFQPEIKTDVFIAYDIRSSEEFLAHILKQYFNQKDELIQIERTLKVINRAPYENMILDSTGLSLVIERNIRQRILNNSPVYISHLYSKLKEEAKHYNLTLPPLRMIPSLRSLESL